MTGMSGDSVVVAAVGTSPGLPEGNTIRGVDMVTDFTHDFSLIIGA